MNIVAYSSLARFPVKLAWPGHATFGRAKIVPVDALTGRERFVSQEFSRGYANAFGYDSHDDEDKNIYITNNTTH